MPVLDFATVVSVPVSELSMQSLAAGAAYVRSCLRSRQRALRMPWSTVNVGVNRNSLLEEVKNVGVFGLRAIDSEAACGTRASARAKTW